MKTTFLNSVSLFFRSLVYSMLSLCSIVFYGVMCTIFSFLPLRYRYMLGGSFLRLNVWFAKVICGIHYQVFGLENLPKDHAAIMLSKHQSTWETYFLPTLGKQTAIILKRELLWIPFFGWGLATLSPIAINRNKTASAMEQIIKKGKQCLEQGRWILIFPEGTRIPFGTIGKYRSGGARLAAATGYPVIPIAHNAGKFWPRRKFLKHPGVITVVIGPLIESKNKTSEEIVEQTKDWIEDTVIKINNNEV